MRCGRCRTVFTSMCAVGTLFICTLSPLFFYGLSHFWCRSFVLKMIVERLRVRHHSPTSIREGRKKKRTEKQGKHVMCVTGVVQETNIRSQEVIIRTSGWLKLRMRLSRLTGQVCSWTVTIFTRKAGKEVPTLIWCRKCAAYFYERVTQNVTQVLCADFVALRSPLGKVGTWAE